MKTQTPVFLGMCSDDGRLSFEPLQAAQRQSYLRSLAGKAIECVIRERRRKRSVDQNAWLWGVALPVLAECLGYDEHEHEMLHYHCLGEYFGYVYDARTGREWPARTSSSLNTKEFSAYMDWLVRWAATEHGCVIPLPGESEAA